MVTETPNPYARPSRGDVIDLGVLKLYVGASIGSYRSVAVVASSGRPGGRPLTLGYLDVHYAALYEIQQVHDDRETQIGSALHTMASVAGRLKLTAREADRQGMKISPAYVLEEGALLTEAVRPFREAVHGR